MLWQGCLSGRGWVGERLDTFHEGQEKTWQACFLTLGVLGARCSVASVSSEVCSQTQKASCKTVDSDCQGQMRRISGWPLTVLVIPHSLCYRRPVVTLIFEHFLVSVSAWKKLLKFASYAAEASLVFRKHSCRFLPELLGFPLV